VTLHSLNFIDSTSVYTGDEAAADIVVLNTDQHMGISPEEKAERMEKRPWQSSAVWGVESCCRITSTS
jgi:hypothetical protein